MPGWTFMKGIEVGKSKGVRQVRQIPADGGDIGGIHHLVLVSLHSARPEG